MFTYACICELHNERLSVFCSTCDFSICHQCALFDNKHEQHSFRPLDEVYNEHVKQIKGEMDQLKHRHLELISLFQDVVSLFIYLFCKEKFFLFYFYSFI
ncbi:unnamed protein product [Trichobilharzia regenti]|nr:unnamed protein product [Trichobilharzia regenti]